MYTEPRCIEQMGGGVGGERLFHGGVTDISV